MHIIYQIICSKTANVSTEKELLINTDMEGKNKAVSYMRKWRLKKNVVL